MYGRGKKLNKSKIQKQSEENVFNSIKNPFIQKKKKKENKDRIIRERIVRDIRTLFEENEHEYCKSRKESNLWNNNYTGYENNGGRNKILLLKDYLNKIKPYLRDITINLQESDI